MNDVLLADSHEVQWWRCLGQILGALCLNVASNINP